MFSVQLQETVTKHSSLQTGPSRSRPRDKNAFLGNRRDCHTAVNKGLGSQVWGSMALARALNYLEGGQASP